MRWGLCTAVIASGVLAAHCGRAPAPEGEERPAISFQAGIELSPPAPKPGERIYFNIGVSNRGSQSVTASVEVSILDEKNGVLYRRVWEDVTFNPDDNYDLLGSFLTEIQSVGKPAFLSVWVLEPGDAGGVLFAGERLASFITRWEGGTVALPDAGTVKADAGARADGGAKADGGRPDAGRADGGR